jgi:hypothetical protein
VHNATIIFCMQKKKKSTFPIICVITHSCVVCLLMRNASGFSGVPSEILRLRLDPLFWECILENAFLLKCILENTFSRMHFAENSAFGKILKLFIRSDYAERKCVWLVF